MKIKLFIGLLFLFGATSVHGADFSLYNSNYDAYMASKADCVTPSAGGNFGYSTSQFQFVTYVSIPTDFTLDGVDTVVIVNGSPTDDLIITVYTYDSTTETFGFSDSNLVATSDSVTATSTGLYHFTFDDDITGGEYVFSIRRSGALSTSNFYQSSSYPSCYIRPSSSYSTKIFSNTNSNSANLGTTLFRITGTITSEGGTCPDVDMASTTEAIYTVGYSITLYLGIFIFLVFFYIAYLFTKRFIRDFRT